MHKHTRRSWDASRQGGRGGWQDPDRKLETRRRQTIAIKLVLCYKLQHACCMPRPRPRPSCHLATRSISQSVSQPASQFSAMAASHFVLAPNCHLCQHCQHVLYMSFLSGTVPIALAFRYSALKWPTGRQEIRPKTIQSPNMIGRQKEILIRTVWTWPFGLSFW